MRGSIPIGKLGCAPWPPNARWAPQRAAPGVYYRDGHRHGGAQVAWVVEGQLQARDTGYPWTLRYQHCPMGQLNTSYARGVVWGCLGQPPIHRSSNPRESSLGGRACHGSRVLTRVLCSTCSFKLGNIEKKKSKAKETKRKVNCLVRKLVSRNLRLCFGQFGNERNEVAEFSCTKEG